MTSFKEFVGKASTDSYTGQSVYKVTATGLEPNTVYYYTYGRKVQQSRYVQNSLHREI